LAAQGGGTVQRTAGTYTYSAAIVMKSNVNVVGVGPATIDKPASASVTTMYDWGTAVGAMLENCTIDGDTITYTHTASGMKVVDGQGIGNVRGVVIQNYTFSSGFGTSLYFLFYDITVVKCSCTLNTLGSTGTGAELYSFHTCTNITSSTSYSNSSTGTGAELYSFHTCTNATSCSSYNNSTAGTGADIQSLYACKNVTLCSSSGNSTTGGGAEVYSFYTCTNMASCSSSGNSTAGGGADISSFILCTRLTVCSTENNVSGSSDEYGFAYCKSVQQCKSDGDSIPYGTGVSQSYADAGTSNACAGTAAGGYNS
jgi:hypothetical protein